MTAVTEPLAARQLAIALLRRKLIVVTVRGISMEPAYHDGDRVLVHCGWPLGLGQVVVVEQPAPGDGWRSRPVSARGDAHGRQWLIKRVTAVPGDPVPRGQVPALAHVPESHVPAGMAVLLGDNRGVSLDSQDLGYFPVDRLLGAVLRPVRGETLVPGR